MTEMASATIAASQLDPLDWQYTITLNNTGSTTVGTFWFAWIPGEDFLTTSPAAITDPTGWTHIVTHGGASDGYAIQWKASSASSDIQSGGSSNVFSFVSADAPSSVFGNSVFFPNTPVTTAFIYGGAPFSDTGFEFVSTAATSLLSTLSTAQQLELIYIGYFDRSGDSGGFSYWSGQATSVTLTNIANLFTPQAETIALYPFLSNPNPNFSSPTVQAGLNTFIGNVYSSLFGHAADSGGLTYWTGQIASGAVGLGAAILAIANGATGSDATILQNKITVALDFTTLTGTANLTSTAAYLTEAKTVLANVDGVSLNDASVSAAEALIAPWIASQPHSASSMGVVGTAATAAHAELV